MHATETPFKPGWVSVPLPRYREEESVLFAYDSLPPINHEQLTGGFQWLTPFDEHLRAKWRPYQLSPAEQQQLQENLKQLVADATPMQLTLPDPFLTFMLHPHLQAQMPFSHYYLDLPDHLRKSALFDNCYFIRFLSESYGPLSWHLYLELGGDHRVVVSLGADLSDKEPLQRWVATGKQITLEWVRDNTFFYAPSFEEFLYRFWFEYQLFIALSEGHELSEEQTRYLAHYTE